MPSSGRSSPSSFSLAVSMRVRIGPGPGYRGSTYSTSMYARPPARYCRLVDMSETPTARRRLVSTVMSRSGCEPGPRYAARNEAALYGTTASDSAAHDLIRPSTWPSFDSSKSLTCRPSIVFAASPLLCQSMGTSILRRRCLAPVADEGASLN